MIDGGAELPDDEVFGQLLAGRGLVAVFQPVVALATGQVIGYEALIRGPADTVFALPEPLFAHAYRTNRVAELDWICRATAFRDAIDADIPEGAVLLVNVEPASLRTPVPPHLRDDVEAGLARFRVVLELTERALAADPAAVAATVRIAHAAGMGIAIDDVGATPASLALMPLLDPDMIKLDLSVVQTHTDAAEAQIVHAVLAESERTGAAILAEGIESAVHAETAQAMGAVLGQGWFFGVPSRQPPPPTEIDDYPARPEPIESGPDETPFQVVARTRETKVTTRPLLVALSRWIEGEASRSDGPAVVLANFQHAPNFDRPTLDRYQRLAAVDSNLVAIFGVDMPSRPAPGVRASPVDPGDPLAREWVVIVVKPHFAAALVAVERGPGGAAGDTTEDGRYDVAITHNRELVIAAARPLLHRMQPEPI